MKLTVVSICGLLCIPLSSQAADALLFNETTALFTVDFSFTDALFTNDIPLLAEPGATYTDRVDGVGFTLTDADGRTVALDTVSALVLSDATIQDQHYHVPVNQKTSFTLLILAELNETPTTDLTARITKIPYHLDGRRTSIHQNQLNDIAPAVLAVE